jgi:hypothetical protein
MRLSKWFTASMEKPRLLAGVYFAPCIKYSGWSRTNMQ